MRLTALAGLFACAVICAVSSSSVSAQATDQFDSEIIQKESFNIGILASITQEAKAEVKPETKPEPVVHQIKPNETLSTIATQYNTTWQRIFNKNDTITDPNVVTPGEKVTIPFADEQLADRPLPIVPEPAAEEVPVATQTQVMTSSQTTYRGTSAGNTYTYGYCTWYAKNMRPDLPNNLGNADTWVARAAAQGIPTGSAARVGAIGQQGMHVVYVQSVNGDGTVTISEMNFVAWNVVSTRTVPASYFQYIY
jgi:N-acetylmuramoyl-L-alanine amidase